MLLLLWHLEWYPHTDIHMVSFPLPFLGKKPSVIPSEDDPLVELRFGQDCYFIPHWFRRGWGRLLWPFPWSFQLRTVGEYFWHWNPLCSSQFHLCANFFQENPVPSSPFGSAITVKSAKPVIKPNNKHFRSTVGSKVLREFAEAEGAEGGEPGVGGTHSGPGHRHGVSSDLLV